MLKYEQIASRISSLIEDGHYEAGDKLPSVKILKTEYDVSKYNHYALKNLEKEAWFIKLEEAAFM